MSNHHINMTLVNDISELEILRTAVEAFGEQLDLPPAVVFKLNLVLDELVTNVISYAFPQDEQHEFRLRLWLEDNWFRAELRDQGLAFNPLEFPPPDLDAPLEERSIGGVGVHFLKKMMDEYTYQRTNGWNCLTFGKNLA